MIAWSVIIASHQGFGQAPHPGGRIGLRSRVVARQRFRSRDRVGDPLGEVSEDEA
jgi:hypothetical protein